jgi:hypothetical protein
LLFSLETTTEELEHPGAHPADMANDHITSTLSSASMISKQWVPLNGMVSQSPSNCDLPELGAH